jgi:Protein of unknown function (DUF3551)
MTAIRTALLAIFLLAAVDGTPSVAEVYRPWCAQYYGFGSGGTNCSFTSYAQCMMTAGPGTGAWCVQNPFYLAYGPGRQSDIVDRPARRRR